MIRKAGAARVWHRPAWVTGGVVLGIAAVFRLRLLGQLIPGLKRDAPTKGLLALKWLRAQADSIPLANSYPTSIWDAGETVLSEMAVSRPADLPAGQYELLFGMYIWQTGERLPITGGRPAIDDRLRLTSIHWRP